MALSSLPCIDSAIEPAVHDLLAERITTPAAWTVRAGCGIAASQQNPHPAHVRSGQPGKECAEGVEASLVKLFAGNAAVGGALDALGEPSGI